MSDFDKELKIKVTVAADASGLKQTLDTLKAASDAAKKNTPGENFRQPEFSSANVRAASDPATNPGNDAPVAENLVPPALNPLASLAQLVVAALGNILQKAIGLSAQMDAARTQPAPDGNTRRNAGGSSPAPKTAFEPDSSAGSSAPNQPGAVGPFAGGLDHGQKIGEAQTALLHSLSGLLAQIHSSTADLLSLVKQSRQQQENLQNQITDLKRSVSQINTNTRGSGNPTPP